MKIAKETSLYYACNEAERPFYGVSMFESAFFHYDKKTKLYYIAHLAAQRAACGTRVGTMKPNPSASDKNNFVKALANLGLAQYIVVPDADWTVNNLEEKGNFDFLGLINHHNSQMSKSVLAAWFDQDQGAGKGDSALVDFGNQDDATWLMMLDSILEEMAQVIDTHIFPRFVDWNFGSGKYPQFKWGELTAEQKAAIQDTFDKLAAAGQTANVTPEFMLELEERMAEDLGLDIDYDKIKAEREKQQKLMQQAGQGAGTDGSERPAGAGRSGSAGRRSWCPAGQPVSGRRGRPSSAAVLGRRPAIAHRARRPVQLMPDPAESDPAGEALLALAHDLVEEIAAGRALELAQAATNVGSSGGASSAAAPPLEVPKPQDRRRGGAPAAGRPPAHHAR